MELSGSNIKKKFFVFQETKLSYISGNGTFLYFGKGTYRTRIMFRTPTYLELQAYSESWYI